MRESLSFDPVAVQAVSEYLLDESNPVVSRLLEVMAPYGTPEEINARAREAGALDSLLGRLDAESSPYLKDVLWLREQRDKGDFVSMDEFCRSVSRDETDSSVDERRAVTLEISALQFFPWLIAEAEQALEKREVMPGRFIRVRNMAEQVKDNGDLPAVAASMKIMGASLVESLDTRGTDGSNIHLGGPETLTGYFGGIGQPNDYGYRWIDEFLQYYTQYGVQEVLNVNSGTVLLGYLLYRLGVDIRFKISVFMGNDNPAAALWTLMMARFLARKDGSTPLVGFNLSNSCDVSAVLAIARIRKALGLESAVRIEHHITEPWRHIVRQPYCRRDDLLELAASVSNLSAKHEGGDPEVEGALSDPASITDYFLSKQEILSRGWMHKLQRDYLLKHDAVNRTARALVARGFSFVAAPALHDQDRSHGSQA
ncbi:MAG: hypothetical protein CSA35_00950 [Dethiosulfovibrio peptidovorans]|nr:MAG: hypothetical protein CSA35_00950 [Dethiosulfovibrio peptidovorans]